MTTAVTQVLIGPARHGVVQFGRQLHGALRKLPCDADMLWLPAVGDVPAHLDAGSHLVHTQFTDRLFGSSPAAAASAFAVFAETLRVQTGGRVLTVTLHDLPQASDGSHYSARVEAYQRVVALCDAVVVNSGHERELLQENGIGSGDVFAIPLPIAVSELGPRAPVQATPTLGVFGFIYPGKGYEEVIAAAEGLPQDVQIHAIGTASPGHEDLIDRIRCAATQQRRIFYVTGHISDDRLVPALRAVTVPVAAHRHISASGSLNSWLAAGRRPLAPATRYTTEIERRNPGCLQLFPDTRAGLRAAIRAALHDPGSTWLPSDVTLRPDPAEAAAAYAEMFRALR